MLSRRVGHLLYDSGRAGGLVDVQGALPADRTLVFRADDVTVDLVIHRPGSRESTVFGRVVSEADGRPVPGVLVDLGEGEPVETDGEGRFSLPHDQERRAKELCLQTADVRLVCVLPGGAAEG